MSKKRSNYEKGKDFEDLVESLEKLLLPEGIKIERNIRLPDKDTTSGTREVDILLTMQIAHYEMKVGIECRDRNDTNDIAWMDSLIRRKEDLGLSRVVGVSTSEFSGPMIEKAKKHDITLRNLNPIDIAELSEWFEISEYKLSKLIIKFTNVNALYESPFPLTPQIDDAVLSHLNKALKNIFEPLFYAPRTDQYLSFDQIWHEGCTTKPDMVSDWVRRLSHDTGPLVATVIQERLSGLELPGISDITVREIVFNVEILREVISVPISQAMKYQQDGKALAYLISFEKEIAGIKYSIDISRTDENIAVNIISPSNVTFGARELPANDT